MNAPKRGADDDENFGGMPQREDVAALEHEAADDASQYNNRADDLNHEVAATARS